MSANHIILFCPLLLPSISFLASGSFQMSQLFASGGVSIGSFSSNISPSNEHLGLISFRMDWLYLLAVQGTLKSLLQHHSSKAFILWHSAFFTVQLSHPYMTPGKTIALTRWTFVGKVMSLLLNMLSRSVITFLPRSMCLLISWLHDAGANFHFSDQYKVYLETALSAASRGTRAIDGPLSQVLNKHLELAAESWAAGAGRRTKAPPSTSIQLNVRCSAHGPESVAMSTAERFGETLRNNAPCLGMRLKVFLGIRIM